MFDPLLTLIAAKAKAVGLVAGTAMVTTALVGGGAVAMTVVSSETDLQEDAAVVQTVESEASPEAEVVALPLADTGTVGITPKPRPSLPADFVCDDSKNHGQNVSAYAQSLPKGPGRGEKVSAVAQSDCGKAEKDEAEVEAAEVEEESEPEPDSAAKKAAQAERKAAKKAAAEERKAAKKSAAEERKAAKGGNGKGGGNGGSGKGGGKNKD